MRLDMHVSRDGQRFQGSVTRVRDQLRLPFSGLLELMAVLERLTSDQDDDAAEKGTDL